MRQSWIRNIFLFSTLVALASSCKKPDYSIDEPLPATQSTTLYIVSEGNLLYAMNPVSGVVKWEFYLERGILHEPLALGEHVFVTTTNNVYRLSAITGKVVDSVISDPPTTTTITNGNVTGAGNAIYVPVVQTVNGLPPASKMLLVDYLTDDQYKLPVWEVPLPGIVPTSPVLFRDLILTASGSELILHSLASNPAVSVWNVSGLTGQNNPTLDGETVYVTAGNELKAIDLTTGIALWSYTAPAAIETSPIIYGGNVIFGCTDNNLYCIDRIAQTPRWVFVTKERIYGSAYAYEQVIYFGGNDHYFYAVNINDGSLKWRYRTDALIRSSPIAYNGKVYVGGYDQYLYAFDTSGSLAWKHRVNGLIDKSPVLYDNDNNKQVYPAISGLSVQ